MPTAEQMTALEALVAETGARLFIWEAEPSAESRAMLDDMGPVQVVFPTLAAQPEAGDLVSVLGESLTDLEAALTEVGSNAD